MHIVVDARVINSGTGTYVAKLLEYLQNVDSSNRYTVLVPTKDTDYWRPTADNFTVKPIDIPNYSFKEQFAYKRILEDLQPDIVHFCMPQQPLLYRGARVTTMHDMTLLNTYNSDKNWLVFHLKQFVGRFVFKRIASLPGHVIAVSENTKREYQAFSHILDEKISVIYEAGEVHSGELIPASVPYERFILYVGQQPDYKNLRRLGDAHQKLLAKYPDLGLVFVGRINEATKRNQTYFETRGYKNIHFTGFLPDAERDWLFTRAAAYVFPSLMEGFGLPPLEAMAYGTPVVSSNASCMPEILGDAAEYFDPLNTDDMTLAIDRVISDESLRQAMRERGLAQVKKYSWQRMAEETLRFYRKVGAKSTSSLER